MKKKKSIAGSAQRRSSAGPGTSGARPRPSSRKENRKTPRATARNPENLERDLLRALMDNIEDHIYFKDAQSRFILINKATVQMFGLRSPDEIVGKTDFDFFTEEHARQAFADEQSIITNGQPVVGEDEKETWPDGRETWVSTTKVALRDREGRIIGTLGSSRDITEKKSMQISLQMATDKLAEMVNWLEGRNREMSVLNELGRLLEECRTPEEAYSIIGVQMEKLIPVHSGRMFLFNRETERYVLSASWGGESVSLESFLRQDCLGLRDGKIAIAHTKDAALCPHIRPPAGDFSLCLCIPLKAQGETIGVLFLQQPEVEQGPVNRLDRIQELAASATDHIALVLANISLREDLRRQSTRDALTGLYNRRYLEESLLREIARANRKKASLGVVMIDVDKLKGVNDLHGHEAGDILLERMGHWLHDNIRVEDISCRYGGDEFLLILPDASLESTTSRARQICEGIRKLSIPFRGQTLEPASVSIGVASFPLHGNTRDELLNAADRALYRAKAKGRDRVIVAGTT